MKMKPDEDGVYQSDYLPSRRAKPTTDLQLLFISVTLSSLLSVFALAECVLPYHYVNMIFFPAFFMFVQTDNHWDETNSLRKDWNLLPNHNCTFTWTLTRLHTEKWDIHISPTCRNTDTRSFYALKNKTKWNEIFSNVSLHFIHICFRGMCLSLSARNSELHQENMPEK